MKSRKFLIIIFAALSVLCVSCRVAGYISSGYKHWKYDKRIKAINGHELPPEDQYLFCVDTIYLKNPVLIEENGFMNKSWIIDAKEKTLNDKLIKSYLADSVKYIYPWGYSFLSSEYSEESEEFRKQWNAFSESGGYFTRDRT